jgi:hypothetical protein
MEEEDVKHLDTIDQPHPDGKDGVCSSSVGEYFPTVADATPPEALCLVCHQYRPRKKVS